ncbi:MAG: TlyA family RNA methyltransferase [Oscillospiraceae bacterium]|nr:TlyA family RNA methyltransferase [Oscillospiraceae bacterium]
MAQTIRLDTLVSRKFGISTDQASALIMTGRVTLNGIIADKPGEQVDHNAMPVIKEKQKKYASRSGFKLEKALRSFKLDVTGLTVCDIGASNGGFTDCLLKHGVSHVFAVDVAYGILEWDLRHDKRVTVLERTNARYLTADKLGTYCDMVTADVSFISLKKIFPAIDAILKPDGCCVCLIKPQFEAAPHQVGKNGVLNNPDDLPPLLLSIAMSAAQSNIYLSAMTVSPIHGTNGNIEYLARFDRNTGVTEDKWPSLIETALSQQPDK